jgi:hypothetical protein
VTNNNEFWIGFIVSVFTITTNYYSSQWLLKTRFIPCWTISVFASTVTDLLQIFKIGYFFYERLTNAELWLTTALVLELESELELLYDSRFTAIQFVLAPSPVRLAARFFSKLNTCGHSLYTTSFLTTGWACNLQLLLALASAFIRGSESRGTRDNILLSEIRDFTFRRLLRLAWLRWRYSTLLPHGQHSFLSARPLI